MEEVGDDDEKVGGGGKEGGGDGRRESTESFTAGKTVPLTDVGDERERGESADDGDDGGVFGMDDLEL
jgi:hypothetical protein